MHDQADMVELSRFMNHEQAELVRERLLEAGIKSFIPDDLLFNVHAGISMASGGVRLVVEEKDIEEARQILEKSVDAYPLPPDFDSVATAEETPLEAGKKMPYGSYFIFGGLGALVLLGLWTALMVPGVMVVAGRVVWDVALIFVIGGLLGIVIHVCSRALTRKNPDKET
jgi:hypothetical protein